MKTYKVIQYFRCNAYAIVEAENEEEAEEKGREIISNQSANEWNFEDEDTDVEEVK